MKFKTEDIFSAKLESKYIFNNKEVKTIISLLKESFSADL